jgi:prepilin-type N-terminal cleavage/methylation domain-containing protein
MKKIVGFTLVELMAVILILGIIALIAVPKISNILEEQRSSIFKQSVSGLVRAVQQDSEVNVGGFGIYREYTYSNKGLYLTKAGNQDVDSKIDISGNIDNGNGKITVENYGKVSLAINNGKYCAKRTVGDTKITVEPYDGECVNDVSDFPYGNSCYTYKDNTDGSITLTNYKYNGSSCPKDVVIPNSIDGKYVTNIASNTFLADEVLIVSYYETDKSYFNYYEEYLQNMPANLVYPSVGTTVKTNLKSKNCAQIGSPYSSVEVPLDYVHTDGDGYYSCYFKVYNQDLVSVNNNNYNSVDFSKATKLTSIPPALFAYSSISTVNIGNYIKNIGQWSFSNNIIQSLSIPDNVEEIGAFAFSDNVIKNLDLSHATSLEYIRDGAFAYNTLDTLTIENLNNLLSIDGFYAGAFQANNLTSVTLKNLPKLTNLGENNYGFAPFYYNYIDNLVMSNLPSLKTIGSYAFSDNNLTSVDIPNSVTLIGHEAFSYNDLNSVTIPPNVTYIDEQAFLKCSCGDGHDNATLTTIVNKTGRTFDWAPILGEDESVTCSFITGTCGLVHITN